MANNAHAILQQQLSAAASGQKGEGLVQSREFLTGTHTAMQYMESLLENFRLGEEGLKNQFPLGMVPDSKSCCCCCCYFVCFVALKYCSVVVHRFQHFRCK